MKLIVSLVVICQLGLALSQEDGARGGDLSEFSKHRNFIIIILLSKQLINLITMLIVKN